MNSAARAGPAAPKVAPASREAIPPGSADPSGAFAVCAVDAELYAALAEVRIVEPASNCSSISRAAGSKAAALPLRCVEFEGLRRLGSPLGGVAARFNASETLSIRSPFL